MLDTNSATDHQEIDTELIFERHVVTGKLVLSRFALGNIVRQSVAIICVKKMNSSPLSSLAFARHHKFRARSSTTAV